MSLFSINDCSNNSNITLQISKTESNSDIMICCQGKEENLSSLSKISMNKINKTVDNNNLSAMEAAILRASIPIEINVKETEPITVLGQKGIWINKDEIKNWNGSVPIDEYGLNEDICPEFIFKKFNKNLEYIQELAVRYLKPSTPPPPGDIIIKQEANKLTPEAPPVIIRQLPPRPCTPKPLIIREAPPNPPPLIGRKLITISGKQLPPPPRKVIVERMPPIPSKPQPLIVERWLPYGSSCKRRVLFQTSPPDPVVIKPKNVLIQWGAPEVSIRQEIKYLGIVKANPIEYAERYGDSLKKSTELPLIGIKLAAEHPTSMVHELEGEIEALKLIDLDAEGLSDYKNFVYNNENVDSFKTVPTNIKNNSESINNSETNITIMVNSSPVNPPIDTSKLASPALTTDNISTFVSCLNEQFENSSKDSLNLENNSNVTLALETSLNNSNNNKLLNESNDDLESTEKVINKGVATFSENTSIFSNINSDIHQPLILENTNIQNSNTNSILSTEFTNITPTIPDVLSTIPGSVPSSRYYFSSPAFSALSSRLSLKSTSIQMISASASATSVASTIPTSAYNSSIFPSIFTNYQSNFLSNTNNLIKNEENVETRVKIPKIQSQDAKISMENATPDSLIKTPAPITVTVSQTLTQIESPSIPTQTNIQTRSHSISSSNSSKKYVDNVVIERLFSLIDINGDGAVSIEEAERIFLKLNSRLKRNYGSDDVKLFFLSLDPTGTGKINLEQFKKAFPNKI